jgi:hypothetical protein
MILSVAGKVRPEELVAGLNRELPVGLHVTDGGPYLKSDPAVPLAALYRVVLDHERFEAEALERFHSAPSFFYERLNRKGKLKKIDLKDMVQRIHFLKPGIMELSVCQRPEALLRPDVILRDIFDLPVEIIRQARIIKLRLQPVNPDKSAGSDAIPTRPPPCSKKSSST